MVGDPLWLKTISNHAMISKKEVCEWLDTTKQNLIRLMEDNAFPQPRFGGHRSKPGTPKKYPQTCRWRVGDIKAWLEGNGRLAKELAVPACAESSARTKAIVASGFDPMGRTRVRKAMA